MHDPIEPVLSASVLDEYEWRSLGVNGVGHPPMPSTLDDISYLDGRDLEKAIAIANATMPDGHPKKITREMIRQLHRAAELYYNPCGLERTPLIDFVDALASYLPPDSPSSTE